MSTLSLQQQSKKLHPHKMLMYFGMGSMTMMFAGWVSAFMVREGQGRWDHVQLPWMFWVSTAVILASSVTIHLAVRAFKKRNFTSYQLLINTTTILGLLFLAFQAFGFYTMYSQQGILLNGNNAAGEFTYVIPFVHGVHVLGGIVALFIVFLSTKFRRRKKVYSSTGVEIVSIYWHFVDALWLYIFIFLLLNQS